MENRISRLIQRIAHLEGRVSSKKLMMSTVTMNALPDVAKLIKMTKKILKMTDSSGRKWSVTAGHSDNPLQTVLVCSHNDVAHSRFQQEVLVVHHQGTGNSLRAFKTEITTGSQSYMQANLATAISFMIKVADAEKQEIMQSRMSGEDHPMIRPVYDFSGRSRLKLSIPVALVVPDPSRLAKSVVELLIEKSSKRGRKVRWVFADSNLDYSNKVCHLLFTSNMGEEKDLYVAFAGSQGSGAKFSFTSEAKTSSSLNVITSHMLADKSIG
jgi:hypothetical protein